MKKGPFFVKYYNGGQHPTTLLDTDFFWIIPCDLLMSINLSIVAILNIKDSDYGSIISLISKNEAILLLQNVDLTEKGGTLK